MKEPSLGADCPIDVNKLVESRLIVQANSGAGKSWAIRRLAEQTYGRAQQIIIDHDGEYHTLREKFDYVLAGQKGDCPADIKSAALLARRLLELNVSAIIDIYELGTQRAEFVKRFLESLVNAPRDLWHSALIILDEAHFYAPETGSAVSSDAVKNLMALGRKRGFAGVLATQRIAKLSKDAVAECNNKLIGRSALDVDMKRAAGELGFTTREDVMSLRTLKAGEFYAFGPAFTDEVKQIKVGAVHTTHLRAGQRAAPPTPPREKVKKILAQLADLPHEAAEEAKSIDELRLQVKQLKTELTKAKTQSPAPEVKTVEKLILTDKQIARLEKLLHKAEAFGIKTVDAITLLCTELVVVKNVWLAAGEPTVLPVKQPKTPPPGFKIKSIDPLLKDTAQALRNRERPMPRIDTNGALPVGEAATLRALIQYPDGLRRDQLTVLTGYKRSTRDAYIARLREKGYVDTVGDRVTSTDTGCAVMPDAEPLPTGEALRDFWFHKLPSGEKQVLQQLVEAYPDAIEKPAIDDATGFKRSTRDAYLSRLAAKQLVVEVTRGRVQASATLFEVDA